MGFFAHWQVTYLLSISLIIKIFRHVEVGYVLQIPAVKASFFNQDFYTRT